MQSYTTPVKKSLQRREASCEHECYSDSRQIPPKGFRCQWDQTTGQLIQAWTNLCAYGGPHHCTHGQLSIASLHKHFTRLHMNMQHSTRKYKYCHMVMQGNLTGGSSQDYVFIKNFLKSSFKSHSALSSKKKAISPLGGSVQLTVAERKVRIWQILRII